MKKARGFVGAGLLMDALPYLLLCGAIVAAGLYIDHRATLRERQAWTSFVQEERGKRRQVIAQLEVDQSDAIKEREEMAMLAATRADKMQSDHEAQLHAYVPPKPPGSGCLGLGFVRFTDSAARGVPLPPGPPPEGATAPSGVGDDEEAAIIARNYAKYHACTRRVMEILDDFDALRTLHNATVAKMNAQVKDHP